MSSIHIAEADEEAQRKIENDIDHYLQIVIDLRRRRNSFIRINRLPPELLSEIFSFCQDGSWDTEWKPSYTYQLMRVAHALKWTYVTAVCHHWRQVAVTTPSLWAHINLDFPRFSRNLSLVLAKQSPLYLIARKPWGTEQTAIFNDVVSCMDRVHTIDWRLINFPISSYDAVNPIPSIISPLRSICMTSTYYASAISKFEKCAFPLLQRVELVNCFSNLPIYLLGPTLTHLILQTDTTQTINLTTFTNSLSRMMRLEVLRLEGMAFDKIGSEHVMAQKLPLPSLCQLVINPPCESHQDYLSFLEILEFPTHAHLNLKFMNTTSETDVPALLCVVSKLFSHVTFRSLALYNSDGAFVIGFWEDIVSPDTFDMMELDPSYAMWLPTFFEAPHSIIWEQFLHVLNLHRVQIIHFRLLSLWGNTQEHWIRKHLLRTTEYVTNLSLMGDLADPVIKFLQETESHVTDTGEAVSRHTVPRLKVIHFIDVVWRYLPEAVIRKESGFMENLSILLSKRAEAMIQIEEVEIKKCRNVDRDVVEGLQEVVAVKWDGYVRKGSESDDSSSCLSVSLYHNAAYVDSD
ncbi:hypothetical protein QCA50_011662 [Cerrena zonata]|uniref:F-box domain-containing protein n=1 Tax=Cerrena zonata TaxID=2478898 RepID=A0AAW0G4R1_9APHY